MISLDLPARVVCEGRYLFTFSRGQAAVGSVQNNLVLPAFLSRNWKHFPAFDRGSKTVYLPRVGKLDSILRQVKLRGARKVDWFFRFLATAANLVRMVKLIPAV